MPEPTTEQGITTPEPTTEQASTTPEPATTAVPCKCAACVEKGNTLEKCILFGLDCACVQTTTTAEPTTVQTSTTPEPTTEQTSTTPEPTTEQGTTTPEPTTEQTSTTPELATTAVPCKCATCMENGITLENCILFGLDCACVQTTCAC